MESRLNVSVERDRETGDLAGGLISVLSAAAAVNGTILMKSVC